MSMSRSLCPVCDRQPLAVSMTRHHVVPKSKGGRETESICRTCHRQLHLVFTNNELEREVNTIEKIRSHPRMQKYLSWVSAKNPDQYFRGKQSKTTRRRR